MFEKDSMDIVKVEETLHFEIVELDDVDLDGVAGGLRDVNGYCPVSNSNCGKAQ